jgi:Ca2+-binding EF-hand superfamily protein
MTPEMIKAIPIADQVFIQIFQECLLPRGLRPHDLFHEIDADKSGEITLQELRDGLFVKFSIELTDAEFAAVSLVADADGSGNIELNELCQILQRGESAEAAADRIFHQMWQTLTLKGMRVTSLFHHCDADGSGEIELDELRQGMDDLLGIKLTEAEFASISQVADKDGSGDISVKELVRIVARGDMKRKAFRKQYDKKMKVNDATGKDNPLRVKTPVTPESDDDDMLQDGNGMKLRKTIVDGVEYIHGRTPSPNEGFDLMGVNRYGPEDLNQTVVRPTVWGNTGHLRIHKPPAARRKEWKKAVGRPDLWHLKLRQQNYVPETILSAPNRPTNKIHVHSHRSRAIEAAAAAAKAYQDGPPSHGTLAEINKTSMSLVEKAARNQLFGESELQDLAIDIRQRESLTGALTAKQRNKKNKGHASPPSPTSGLEDMSTMSGGSALPLGYGPGTSMADGGSSGLHQISHPGHKSMSGHMLQMSEPLYWRKRVKHPSARHSIRNSSMNPQLAYSCTLAPRADQKPQPPNKEQQSIFGTTGHRQDHRKLVQNEGTPAQQNDGHLTQVHEHLALEDASSMLARQQAAGLRATLKKKQRLNFAKALYLGEPAALRRAVKIQEQQELEMKKQGHRFKPPEFYPVHPTTIPHRPPIKVGSDAYIKAQEKSRRLALHTECSGYEQSKLNTEKYKTRKHSKLRDKDAQNGYDEINRFEQRQTKQGHEWEPTTGKDWHREQRFLNQVLQQHTKDPKLAQKFTQFRRDYKRKAKTVTKKVQDKGYEYVQLMNKLRFRDLHAADDEDEDLSSKTARHRWRKGNVGVNVKVKGDRLRERALKKREARLLNLRNFSGFGRRHLEFISEQLYMSIIKLPQPPGKTIQPMQIMANAFDAIDEDLSGSIDTEEFSRAMMRLDLGLSQEAIHELLEVIDNDGDGEVDKTEFLAAMKFVHKKLRNMSYADVHD